MIIFLTREKNALLLTWIILFVHFKTHKTTHDFFCCWLQYDILISRWDGASRYRQEYDSDTIDSSHLHVNIFWVDDIPPEMINTHSSQKSCCIFVDFYFDDSFNRNCEKKSKCWFCFLRHLFRFAIIKNKLFFLDENSKLLEQYLKKNFIVWISLLLE